ncbi:thiamine phosphate synthase [Bradyrhizobium sp. WD16]|uniref:thiamine phosphate synthase n=1 Tax=Bradyrhizobium sp. WD16 TaxID=1521768 RepID=UPI0020A3FE01|nr:thiamine phosphate synthase [Bradyrhizobium sp. WD16]UTD27249.1 thiamine phosphate synthase [Bradyrhizobium sp. WD16]
MSGKSKPASSRPAPRLYLATPVMDDPASLAARLPDLLAGLDIAAVLVRLAPSDPRSLIERAKLLAKPIQAAGAACLLDNLPDLVARAGADGAHLRGIEALKEALPSLKPDRIAGCGHLAMRHEAMTAGEIGADYVLFGEPDDKGHRPAPDAIAERLGWWAELFEPPCVGYAANLTEAAGFAAAGADFILADDLVWSDDRGARAALEGLQAAIGPNADGGFGTALAEGAGITA